MLDKEQIGILLQQLSYRHLDIGRMNMGPKNGGILQQVVTENQSLDEKPANGYA
jgi:hypothetical protein